MKHLQFTKMKSKLLAVLVCLFAGNGLFANTSSFPVTCVTTGMLNVRQQPSKNGKVVGLLRKDNTVVVDSLHNDDLLRLLSGGAAMSIDGSIVCYKFLACIKIRGESVRCM